MHTWYMHMSDLHIITHVQGPGVQHMALSSKDIFATLQKMQRTFSETGCGFQLMPAPGDDYYKNLPSRIGSDHGLSQHQLQLAQEYGLLIDRDDQGILLQIFTKPLGDRPTVFIEIIQRVGCIDPSNGVQKPGCGGFGKVWLCYSPCSQCLICVHRYIMYACMLIYIRNTYVYIFTCIYPYTVMLA